MLRIDYCWLHLRSYVFLWYHIQFSFAVCLYKIWRVEKFFVHMHFSSNHFELVWRSRGIAFYYYQQFKLQVGYSNITAFCWKFLKSNLKTIRWTFGKLGCDASSTIMFFIGCSSIYIMCIISIQRLYIILMNYYINNCKNGSFILIFNFKVLYHLLAI